MGRNQLWRLNTRNFGKLALTLAIENLSKVYMSDPCPPADWWDNFKADARSICRSHSISEASRKRGHMAALSSSVEGLCQRALSSPNDLEIQFEYLAQRQHIDSQIALISLKLLLSLEFFQKALMCCVFFLVWYANVKVPH